MLEALGNSVECPICFDVMVAAIKQCSNGHSICENCSKKVKQCPLCKSTIASSRNYQLEHVIANLKKIDDTITRYKNAKRGYKRKLDQVDLEGRPLSYGNQENISQSSKVANLDSVRNSYSQPVYHFGDDPRSPRILVQTWIYMKVDTTRNFSDAQLVSYDSGDKGEELFLYNHRIDVWKKEAYWLLQHAEPKVRDCEYFYEFSIRHGSLQTMTVCEICQSDTEDVSGLIASGKCIIVPFSILRKYFSEDQKIFIRFNIREIKKEFGNPSGQSFKLLNNVHGENWKGKLIMSPNMLLQHPTGGRSQTNGNCDVPPLRLVTSGPHLTRPETLPALGSQTVHNATGNTPNMAENCDVRPPSFKIIRPRSFPCSEMATTSRNQIIEHLPENTLKISQNSNFFSVRPKILPALPYSVTPYTSWNQNIQRPTRISPNSSESCNVPVQNPQKREGFSGQNGLWWERVNVGEIKPVAVNMSLCHKQETRCDTTSGPNGHGSYKVSQLSLQFPHSPAAPLGLIPRPWNQYVDQFSGTSNNARGNDQLPPPPPYRISNTQEMQHLLASISGSSPSNFQAGGSQTFSNIHTPSTPVSGALTNTDPTAVNHQSDPQNVSRNGLLEEIALAQPEGLALDLMTQQRKMIDLLKRESSTD